jgi:thiol-disulfide isomerase/thioredoxin
MVILKYEPEKNVKKLKGPCVIVIHAEWCGHCKDFMPVYKNEIVPSNNFDEELKDLLTLSSVEDKEYLNAKDLFGEIDGYPTIRYITFDESGKPLKDNNGAIMKIDAANIPRKAKDITEWINTVVKRDVNKKKHKRGHNIKHAHDMRGGSKNIKRSKRVRRTKRVVKSSKKISKKVKKSSKKDKKSSKK